MYSIFAILNIRAPLKKERNGSKKTRPRRIPYYTFHFARIEHIHAPVSQYGVPHNHIAVLARKTPGFNSLPLTFREIIDDVTSQ